MADESKKPLTLEDLHPLVQARLLEITELVNRMPFATDNARDKMVTFLAEKYFTQDPQLAWREGADGAPPCDVEFKAEFPTDADAVN